MKKIFAVIIVVLMVASVACANDSGALQSSVIDVLKKCSEFRVVNEVESTEGVKYTDYDSFVKFFDTLSYDDSSYDISLIMGRKIREHQRLLKEINEVLSKIEPIYWLTIEQLNADSAIITFGKTKLKVYKCGRVDRLEWKTMIENPNNVLEIQTGTFLVPNDLIGGGLTE